MQIKCPITDEVLATFGKDGFTRRANYREVYLVLSDHSRMKILISKNAKDNLKKSQLEDILRKIKNDRVNNIRSKALPKNKKNSIIKSIENIEFSSAVDKGGILISRKILAEKI